MKSTVLLAVALLFLSSCAQEPATEPAPEAAPAAESASDTGADPLSGTWTGDWGPSPEHRNPVTLELTWNGTALMGTVNPGPDAIELSAASFDAEQNTVTMEAEAVNFRGESVHYTIEGQLEGNSMMGSWTHDDQEGTFSIARN